MAKSQTLIIDQCYFGEKDRGHGLLSATFNDKDLAAYLSRISDLPISKPADVQPEPFYGCHKHDGYLIFTKTLIDKSGSRPGLVFTHALIIDVEASASISNLKQVFDLFVSEIPERGNHEIYQTEIELIENGNADLAEPDKDLLALVNFLLTKKSDQICVLGLSLRTPEIFINLWNAMIPKLRQFLTFRLAFTYTDTHHDQYQIYFTPNSLLQKWPNESRVDNHLISLSEASLAIKLLIGSSDADRLKAFIHDINFRPVDFDGFMLCELAFKSYSQLNDLNESKLLQLIRLLIKLSPHQSDGKTIKSNILLKLKTTFSDKLPDSMLLLSFSNIDISSLNDIDQTISSQISKHISDAWNENNLDLTQDILNRRLEEENMIWWTASVDSTFQILLKSVDESSGTLLWALWSKIELSIGYLSKFIMQIKNIENLLIKTIPKATTTDLRKKITEISKDNKWYLLHARLIISLMSAENALKEQLKLTVDDKPSLTIISEVFEPIEFVKFAIDSYNSTLLDLAATVSVTSTELLTSFDADSLNWQNFISLKIKQLLSKKRNVEEFRPIIQQVLERLSTDLSVSEDLLAAISNSELSDLSWHQNRQALWNKFPIGLKNSFLIATGNSILNQLPTISDIESALHDAFLSLDVVGKYMGENSGNWDRILNVFDYLNNLPQKYLSDHLSYSRSDISSDNAKRLGKLVFLKRWNNCASIIYEKANYYSGFKIALGQCGELLDFWKRLKINFTYTDIPKSKNVSQTEWLSNFEGFCNELYQEESDIRYVWKRAGGDVSDLKSKESAREIWHHALGRLEKGNMHELTFRMLLQQMANDNPAKRDKFNMLLNSLNQISTLT